MMLPIILLVLAAATPFGLGARLATSRRVLGRASHVLERRWLVLMGELVDVGGYRLYCHCQGTGGPTVIMDSGLNQPIKAWGLVPSGVAKFTRVCAYDRTGIGLS